jgi:2-polyprenyl-3-methyl-5-hydroxy-6-metoxy-1,4-benzoquinol methylase
MLDKIKSPITGSTNTVVEKIIDSKEIISLYSDQFNFDASSYFKDLEEIYVVKCLDTNYRFYYPFSIQGKEDIYKHLQNVDFYYLEDRWEFGAVCKLIAAGSSLLELGCGNGYALENFKKNGISCKGLELNQEAIKTCIEKGLDVLSSPLHEYADQNESLFDVVCAFQLLEHLADVDYFIKNSLKLLKRGGSFIVSVPNNDSFGHLYNILNLPPHHMGLWNKKVFLALQKYYPMKLEKVLFTPLDPSQLKDFKAHYATVLGKLPFLLRSISRFPALFNVIVPKRLKGYTIVAIFKKV